MFEEFPPEIPRFQDLPLALHTDDPGEDLVSPERPLDLRLGVPDQIIALRAHPADPVHHILPAVSLIEHHVPLPELPVRLREIDVIPVMTEKGGHAAPRDPHGDDFALLRDLPQDRDIFSCIHDTFFHYDLPPFMLHLRPRIRNP